MIVDWEAPFTLESQFGQLDLNASSGDRYLLDRSECDAGADLRVSTDNNSSRDGGIIHNPFSSWYAVRMVCSLWVDEEPACGEDLNRMVQTIQLHLNGMKHEDGRVFYTPTGYSERLMDNVRLIARLTHTTTEDSRMSKLSWGLASPFPYIITAAQNIVDIGGTAGSPITLTNNGNTDFFPVYQVEGPVTAGSSFEITNNTTGLTLIYDTDLPGAAAIGALDYVEIDTFRDTVYLNGDDANRKAGIVVADSDFFPFVPGNNEIAITGARMTVLYNDAWA